MTIFEISYHLILDNIQYFGVLAIIYILLDILGWAFLGRKK